MTSRRRALLLLGLAALLGGLAASAVARRETALRDALGPAVPVVVANRPVAAGGRLTPAALAVRWVPARYAPPVRYGSARAVLGARAAVAIPPDVDITPAMIDDGRAAIATGLELRAGERVADIVAVGSPALVRPGGRVDVLVTRDRGDGTGATRVALQDAEVLEAAAAPGPDGGAPRVAISLRVTVRQAVYLAAAQSYARELRVLARAPGDRRRAGGAMLVDSRLGR